MRRKHFVSALPARDPEAFRGISVGKRDEKSLRHSRCPWTLVDVRNIRAKLALVAAGSKEGCRRENVFSWATTANKKANLEALDAVIRSSFISLASRSLSLPVSSSLQRLKPIARWWEGISYWHFPSPMGRFLSRDSFTLRKLIFPSARAQDVLAPVPECFPPAFLTLPPSKIPSSVRSESKFIYSSLENDSIFLRFLRVCVCFWERFLLWCLVRWHTNTDAVA